MQTTSKQYDVALSFAGEQREYVEKVASVLKKENIPVFYDDYEKTDLWGANLIDRFDEIYGKKSRYVVMFISEEYEKKAWTNQERQIVLARNLYEEGFLLPARFDNTKIKGLPETISYVNLEKLSPENFAAMIIQKIKGLREVKTKSTKVDFLLPKKAVKVNPYKERNNFIIIVENELKRRCQHVPELDFHSEDVGDRRKIRILYKNNLLYSLDIQKGGISGDQGVSFSLGGNGYNAWGDFEWSPEKNSPVLNMNDLSIFGLYGDKSEVAYKEFADNVWNKIIEEIERHNNH